MRSLQRRATRETTLQQPEEAVAMLPGPALGGWGRTGLFRLRQANHKSSGIQAVSVLRQGATRVRD